MKEGMSFGEFFKEKRLALGKTLREFCLEHGLDPVHISKLERGRLAPPKSDSTLRKYAECLRLNSKEWETFRELARIGAGRIPEYLTDEEILARLPVFFRALKGTELTEAKLDRLIEMIRES